jgi:hypothetical protein
MPRAATVKSRVFPLAGVAAVVAAGAAALHTDLLLDRGFGKALHAPRAGLSFEATTSKEPAAGATVGDEGYWLTRAEVESPSPFAKALAVGDRISISGRDGRQRELEVVDLKVVGGPAARGVGAALPRLLLVTCRVSGEAGDGQAPVRFIVEGAPADPRTPAPAKAL